MIPLDVYRQTILGFFSPIRPFIDDPSVTEIMINGPETIFIEQKGRIFPTSARFDSNDALLSALRNLAQYAGKILNEDRPILEAHLPDGSRVEAVLPPAAPNGPCVAIRKFSKDTLTIDQLIRFGALTEEAALALNAFVVAKLNVIVAGGTGSGKTSLLGMLGRYVPDDQRIVVIEDTRELQIDLPHVVNLEARPADAKGRGEVRIRDLFRATLRMRPDRIVVGEIRGGEALELLQAMTSGHGGCLSTLHATYPHDVMTRLETMALMSDVELPLSALRMQIGSAINFIVQTSRFADGSRGITHITEVQGYDANHGYHLVNVFERYFEGQDEHGRTISDLRFTGNVPKAIAQAQSLGLELPHCFYG